LSFSHPHMPSALGHVNMTWRSCRIHPSEWRPASCNLISSLLSRLPLFVLNSS
jgi:hypothetical protein